MYLSGEKRKQDESNDRIGYDFKFSNKFDSYLFTPSTFNLDRGDIRNPYIKELEYELQQYRQQDLLDAFGLYM